MLSSRRETCSVCGREGSTRNPVCYFVESGGTPFLLSEYPSSEAVALCVKCLLDLYNRRVADLEREVKSLRAALQARSGADAVADAVIEEVRAKGSVSLGKDIVIYRHNSAYYLKVTDYKKGYWAEVPLEEEKLRALLRFFRARSRGGAERRGGEKTG